MIRQHGERWCAIHVGEAVSTAALEHQSQFLDSDLTIVLTDDAQMKDLNRDYLGIDVPTDVLSFPASESDGSEIDPETVR